MIQKLDDNAISSFKGEYEKFSNFYPVLISYEKRTYPSVEHAFVAAKSLDEMFRKSISELPANQAGKAKRMGRNRFICTLRKNWDLKRIPIMKDLLLKKFAYSEFKSLLLSTEDALLIEGNYWHDNFWGDCYCKKCVNIKGLNNLGKLIMAVRKVII